MSIRECPGCGNRLGRPHEPRCPYEQTVEAPLPLFAKPARPVLVPLSEERRAAQDGIRRAEENADEDWKRRAYLTGCDLARRLPEFCSDDLWGAGLEKPREARALGAVMQRLAKEGLIESTSRFVKTRQAGRHAADVRVWRSLVYRATGAA